MRSNAMLRGVLVAFVIAAPLLGRASAVSGPVRFQPHDLAELESGYAVAVADFDNDGQLDVIANSIAVPELAWYENPTWARHVIVSDVARIVNHAMADIDGDGIPEVAFQSAFAMQAANGEGLNWIAKHRGDPTAPWKAELIDCFETSHHVAWADVDGDGRVELVNAPLIGASSRAPTYDQGPSFDLLVRPGQLAASHGSRRHPRDHPSGAAGSMGRGRARGDPRGELRRRGSLSGDR